MPHTQISVFIWRRDNIRVEPMTDADTDAGDDTRTSATTYLPEYQKRIWTEHADHLDMTQSEFIRTMVQAGRRGFDPGRADDGSSAEPEAGADDLDDQVERALAGSDHPSWEELVDVLTGNIEDRLEASLERLQEAGRVRHSGRHGGYTLIEDE